MIEKFVDCPEELKTEKGYGKTIEGDKCDSHWSDVECPIPAIYAEYHYGQFGHKVMFYFCEKCYQNCLKRREHWFFKNEDKDRGSEFL